MIQQANPAVGRRISMGHILDSERREMGPAEFGRERLGWHDPEPGDLPEMADWRAGWLLAADDTSEPEPPYAFSLVFSADRKWAAIGLAARRGDRQWHVEPAAYQRGTAWAVKWLTERCMDDRSEKYIGEDVIAVVVDPAGHEASEINDLENAGITVIQPNYRDIAAAYGMFYDAVTDDRNLHFRDPHGDLTVAAESATTRDIGDAGKAWGRKKSGGDISLLVAVTQALWAHAREVPEMESEPGAWVL